MSMTNVMREAKTLMAALWPGTLHSAAPRPHCHPVDAGWLHYHVILRGVYYLFWDAIATIASNLWRFTIFNKRLNYLMHFPQFIFQYDMIWGWGQFQFSLFISDAGRQSMNSIGSTYVIWTKQLLTHPSFDNIMLWFALFPFQWSMEQSR